jgi:hypothetical protein
MPASMKPHITKKLVLTAFIMLAAAMAITAAPINFNEISLWVRSRETDQAILSEVSQRKLAHPLTPQQEATIKAQGASNSLVNSLRSPNLVAPPVPPSEAKPAPSKISSPQETIEEPEVDVFDVSPGHAINLSQWGGPDYDIAINVSRFAGEDVIEPVIIDAARTYTDVATYHGLLSNSPVSTQPHFRSGRFTPYIGGDLKDDTYSIGNYVSVVSHTVSHGLSVDWRNPVAIRGVPYVLYPIYGARGVGLFYISCSSDSVKLAISAFHH